MSSITLPSLPDPILHLICVYLTPDRPTVNDEENGQSPALYRPIINLSLTAHALNRISSTHIATNISLTDCCTRWDLFLRTVTTNPTYAFNVKYLKLNEGTVEEWLEDRPTKRRPSDYDGDNASIDELIHMFKALCGLEVLYSHHGKANYPGSILHRLQEKEIPLWRTLEVVRFDQVNEWGEDRIVQIHFVRQNGKIKGKLPIAPKISPREPGTMLSTGNELLTGALEGVNFQSLGALPDVHRVEITTRDYSDDGDDEEDGDWVDDEESDGWSERDYEDDSDESSDWDSEDDSDYEDDWEAEYGFTPSPKVGPVKDLPVPSSTAAPPVRGPSLLDF
jgi:hypothetical protein